VIGQTPVEILESQKPAVRQAWFRYALMRAFGWFSVVFGVLTIVVLALATYGGAKLPIEEPVISVVVAVLLILGGSSMARYRPLVNEAAISCSGPCFADQRKEADQFSPSAGVRYS
jgi:hypothetical protein